jgi:D-sedoheptulose 7-phosphate isomerase
MSHLATGKQFKGICLSDNTGLITAYANDLSYDDIYSEQVKNLMKEGDLLIIVSGSGNSENVVRAIDVANDLGCETLAICGYDGGKVKKIARHSLHIKSFDMQLCEDAHFMFGHMVMKRLCGDSISN